MNSSPKQTLELNSPAGQMSNDGIQPKHALKKERHKSLPIAPKPAHAAKRMTERLSSPLTNSMIMDMKNEGATIATKLNNFSDSNLHRHQDFSSSKTLKSAELSAPLSPKNTFER